MKTMRNWLKRLWTPRAPALTDEQRQEILLHSHPKCC